MVAIGERVKLKGQPATVRYVGKTEFSPGEWVGLELDTPTGKNNGTVQGVEYFKCSEPGDRGVFVRPTLLDSRSPVPQDVVIVVNRLQQKLRDVLNENSSLRKSLEAITKKLKVARSELSSTVLSLESASVETEYLRDQNAILTERIDTLQATYDDLSTDYEILKEELEIYKELEDAVSLQVPSESDLTIEDFTVLMQLNKRLELANTSLQKLMNTKENNFNSEIDCLKNELANATTSAASFSSTAKKLDAAENSIKLLQEQLESTLELVSIVERVSNENEALHSKIGQLTLQVEELTELNEIDKALEAEHLQKENELRSLIATLNESLKKESTTVKSLITANKQLKENLNKSALSVESTTEDTELSSLRNELTEIKALNEQNTKENMALRGDLKFLNSFYSKIVPSNLRKAVSLLNSISLLFDKVSIESCPEESQYLFWRRFGDILLHAIAALEYHHQDVNVEILAVQFDSFFDVYKSKPDFLSLLNAVSSLEYVVLKETLPLMELTWKTSKLATSLNFVQIQAKKFMNSFPEGTENDATVQLINKCQDILLAIEAARGKHRLAYLATPILELMFNDDVINFTDPVAIDNINIRIDSVLESIESNTFIPMSVDTIYSTIRLSESKKDKEALESLQIELEKKRSRIQDLQLHVGLLEKNMTLSLDEKTNEIEAMQSLFEKSQALIIDLENQLIELKKENAELSHQMEALFESNENSKYQQTKYFHDKTANSAFLLTEALIDEIQLLKRMLKPQRERNNWSQCIDWIHEPLYTANNTTSSKYIKGLAYLEEAHRERRATRDLIRAISKPAPSSHCLRYLRSVV